MVARLNGLAVCAGLGGIELALSRALPNYRTICYIERSSYAAATLVARMETKALALAPIADDLEAFDGRPWRGLVDIVTAGLPCQPFSQAGKRGGLADERWLGDLFLECLRGLGRPKFVLVENVRGFVRDGLPALAGGLSDLGYRMAWDLFRASDVGAPHRRERMFLLGHLADAAGRGSKASREPQGGKPNALDRGDKVADADRGRREKQWQPQRERVASSLGRQFVGCHFDRRFQWPPGPDDADGWREWLDGGGPPPAIKPGVCGGANGLSNRVERLHALGNAVVPAQCELALAVLSHRLGLTWAES